MPKTPAHLDTWSNPPPRSKNVLMFTVYVVAVLIFYTSSQLAHFFLNLHPHHLLLFKNYLSHIKGQKQDITKGKAVISLQCYKTDLAQTTSFRTTRPLKKFCPSAPRKTQNGHTMLKRFFVTWTRLMPL
ncbi:unnamed protein product [Absidia cylindrospora]